MGFFSRKKHPLPKFPHDVAPKFRELCELLSDEDVQTLIPQVDDCLAQLERDAVENPTIDIVMGRKLAELSRYLLTEYPSFDDKQKPLILGAVRYFAIGDDSLSEHIFVTGFLDDVKVMNHVLEEIEREDLIIEL